MSLRSNEDLYRRLLEYEREMRERGFDQLAQSLAQAASQYGQGGGRSDFLEPSLLALRTTLDEPGVPADMRGSISAVIGQIEQAFRDVGDTV